MDEHTFKDFGGSFGKRWRMIFARVLCSMPRATRLVDVIFGMSGKHVNVSAR